MTDYAIRHGFLAESGPDAVPAWSAHAPGYLHEDHYPPCLVVTGNLDAARRRLAPPPTLPSFRKVAGTCPACSGSTLMLGAGDHVTCSWIGCPDPMAARRRLDPPDDAAIERAARAMFKRVYPGSWTWTDDQRYAYMASARVALAAAEEHTDA